MSQPKPAATRRPARLPRRVSRPIAELLEDRRLLTISFATPTSIATGAQPRGVILADFNSDDKLDVAYAETAGNRAVVRLGDGKGAFDTATPATLVTATSPLALAAADINGDGKRDLVVANFLGDNFSVLYGNGNGTFQDKFDIVSGGTGPQGISVADYNADAKFDVVVSHNGGTVTFLRGNGDGTFAAPVELANVASPRGIVATDLDGDLDPDLVVAADSNLVVVRNLTEAGEVKFAPPVSSAAQGTGGYAVGAGNFHSSVDESHIDLVQTNSNSNAIAIFSGNGDGTVDPSFTQEVITPTGNVFGVSIADFDKDGKPDVLAARGGGLSALRGVGNGTFDPFTRFDFGTNLIDLATGDLNGDGNPDVVAADFADGKLFTALNTSVPSGPAISIGDGLVLEEDEGTKEMVFPVTLSVASTTTVTVQYETVADSAKAGSDYIFKSGQVSFAPGETQANISISIVNDSDFELFEAFRVVLSQPVNAPIADGVGEGAIADDDQVSVTLSITDVTVAEGNAGNIAATFTVALSAASTDTVTVQYSTASGTAAEGEDFLRAEGTLTFTPGQTTQTFNVNVIGDTRPEAAETFSVNLTNATGAAIADGTGTATITDDELPVIITVTDAALTVSEAAGSVGITFTRSGPTNNVVVVSYTVGSTAQQVTFQPGEGFKTVTVPFANDTVRTGNREIVVTLTGANNGGTLGDARTTRVTVVEDDLGVVGPPTVTIRRRRGRVTAVLLQFAGDLNAGSANNLGAYRLVRRAGRDRVFGTADDRQVIRLRSAAYDPASRTVTLTPRQPFAVRPSPRLLVSGTGSTAVLDSLGRPIDGDNNGTSGGNATLTVLPVVAVARNG